MSLLAGKIGLVFGVANQRSIAWAIAQAWHEAGATLAFTYQGERLKANVEELAATFGPDTLILPCDVTKDDEIAAVFSQVARKIRTASSAPPLRRFCPARGAGRRIHQHLPRGLLHRP